MLPILLPAETVRSFCARAVTTFRSGHLENLLVERGAGRIRLAASNGAAALVFCHLPAPLPLTAFQRKVAAAKWHAEAMCFAVPFANLRAAGRASKHRITLAPGELFSGPLLLSRWPLGEDETPPIPLAIEDTREGWTELDLQPARVDVTALAALA